LDTRFENCVLSIFDRRKVQMIWCQRHRSLYIEMATQVHPQLLNLTKALLEICSSMLAQPRYFNYYPHFCTFFLPSCQIMPNYRSVWWLVRNLVDQQTVAIWSQRFNKHNCVAKVRSWTSMKWSFHNIVCTLAETNYVVVKMMIHRMWH
jgi:hypothetical protein